MTARPVGATSASTGSTGPRSRPSSTKSGVASTRQRADGSTSATRPRSGVYDDDARYRSTIDMARHRFGEGDVPLLRVPASGPSSMSLRPRSGRTCYRSRADWAAAAGSNRRRGPMTFDAWIDECHAARTAATHAAAAPLRPRRLEHAASRPLRRPRVPAPSGVRPGLPDVDYTGGEFVVVEQRPRAQSRATVTVDPAGPRRSCSRPATARCAHSAAGRTRRCGTA